ncbi:hypothetical protein [Fibrella aestuarina]|nr:hypothetical protein [Fibrella aestuarina]
MSTVQRYQSDPVDPTDVEPVALAFIPTFYSESLRASLSRLRDYLHTQLYDALLTDFVGDPDDCELRLDTHEMLLKLHEAFVSYCGPVQLSWYLEFVKEAQYLYELQGLAFPTLVHDLQLPAVQAQLSQFV